MIQREIDISQRLGEASMDTQLSLLLRLFDEGYNHKAWHGPNLLGAVRRLTAAEAAWRPAESRHSIWEITVHCAYWKYAVRRRIVGLKRGSFPHKGSNWFPRLDHLTEERWKADLRLLADEHHHLREVLLKLPASRLKQTTPGGTMRIDRLIYGVAAHDIYHAGQIQFIKRLLNGETQPVTRRTPNASHV
jgi:uncharacterized damage-inducible protein DinB